MQKKFSNRQPYRHFNAGDRRPAHIKAYPDGNISHNL